MDIERCDCSEFERREGYIPCESMMAGEISSLKGKPMSRDLFEMDQHEYVVIKQEEIELNAVKDKEWRDVNQPMVIGGVMFLVASIVGLVVTAQFGNGWVLLGSVGCGILSLIGFISATSRTAENNKKLDIEDNRLARLGNKVHILEGKMETVSESKVELKEAKDFFKTKYDLYIGLRHRPITNVTTYVHSLHSTHKRA